MRTGALILAAGKANRFGSPKQLLEIHGETLIDRACRTALEAGCQPVLRLLGAHAEMIREHPCPAGVETFVHTGWEKGMGSSLAAGVSRLQELCPELDAVIVMLADQPAITTETLGRLMERFEKSDSTIILCGHKDTLGPPALFAARHFGELTGLDGDEGGKAVIRKHHDTLASVPSPEADWDIDDENAWQRFRHSQSRLPHKR